MTESSKQRLTIEVTADVVSAFVAKNAVPANELPAMIRAVHGAIVNLTIGSRVAMNGNQPAVPAVPVSLSIEPDFLVCLEDGKKFISLRRHLRSLGITPEAYRAKWDLPKDYPMVAPNYSKSRSSLAKKIGLGRSRRPPFEQV